MKNILKLKKKLKKKIFSLNYKKTTETQIWLFH